jgi:hypothetical protein
MLMAARVVSRRKSATRGGIPGTGSAGKLSGMNKNDSFPPVQFLHQRLLGGIAQIFPPDAAEKHHAVGFQHIEAVGKLAERALHVGKS